ncbi:MAG: alanine dehydrogenase, partial [Deltaproteobacteria bacterium]|nr:alanine dehydrogenase [Deltaproteobacteria bacterium]
MIIGIPKEIKEEELRVAITPAGVSAFVAHGHKVLIEKGAGVGSGILDKEYRKAGATVINDSDSIWEKADMILKVKEPLESEYPLIRKDQIIFT